MARNRHSASGDRAHTRLAEREHLAARSERIECDQDRVDLQLDVRARLLELLRALPEAQRHVLARRYVDDLLPHEIAKELGVSVHTVKARLARALVFLRAGLDRATGGDRSAWAWALLPSLVRPGVTASASGGSAAGMVVLVALLVTIPIVGWWLVEQRGEGAHEQLVQGSTLLDSRPAHEPEKAVVREDLADPSQESRDEGQRVFYAAMGRAELSGGTHTIGFDGAAFLNMEGILGGIRNDGPRVLTGLAISLEVEEPADAPSASAWRMELGGHFAALSKLPRGVAGAVTGLSLAPGEELRLRIQEVVADGAGWVLVGLTPSFTTWSGGGLRAANALPSIELLAESRSARSETQQAWHDVVLVDVTHSLEGSACTQLEGVLELPSGLESELKWVHVFDPRNERREFSATVRLDGSRFKLTDFPHLENGVRYTLVLTFSAALEGQPLRLSLTPTFDH